MAERIHKLSKEIDWLLKYGYKQRGLQLRADGWARVDAVLATVRGPACREAVIADVQEMVRDEALKDGRPRFDLTEDPASGAMLIRHARGSRERRDARPRPQEELVFKGLAPQRRGEASALGQEAAAGSSPSTAVTSASASSASAAGPAAGPAGGGKPAAVEARPWAALGLERVLWLRLEGGEERFAAVALRPATAEQSAEQSSAVRLLLSEVGFRRREIFTEFSGSSTEVAHRAFEREFPGRRELSPMLGCVRERPQLCAVGFGVNKMAAERAVHVAIAAVVAAGDPDFEPPDPTLRALAAEVRRRHGQQPEVPTAGAGLLPPRRASPSSPASPMGDGAAANGGLAPVRPFSGPGYQLDSGTGKGKGELGELHELHELHEPEAEADLAEADWTRAGAHEPAPLPPTEVERGGSDTAEEKIELLTSVPSDVDTATSASDLTELLTMAKSRKLCSSLRGRVACYTDKCLMLVPSELYDAEEFSISVVQNPQPLPKGLSPAGPCVLARPHEKRVDGTIWLMIPACPFANRVLRSTPDGGWEELENAIFREGYAIVGVNHFCHFFPVTDTTRISVIFEAYWSPTRGRVRVVLNHASYKECEHCKDRIEEIFRDYFHDGWLAACDGAAQWVLGENQDVCFKTGEGPKQRCEQQVIVGDFPDVSDALWVPQVASGSAQADSAPVLEITRPGLAGRKTIAFDGTCLRPEPPPAQATILELDHAAGRELQLCVSCNAQSFKECSKDRWASLAEYFASKRSSGVSSLRGSTLRFEEDDKYFKVVVKDEINTESLTISSSAERDQAHGILSKLTAVVEQEFGTKRAFGHMKINGQKVLLAPAPSAGRPVAAAGSVAEVD